MRINTNLTNTEANVADSVTSLLGLTLAMVQARELNEVPSSAGQAILTRAQRAQQALLSAQSDIFRIHEDLRKLNSEIRMMPDENGECPGTGAELPNLAISA